MKTALFAIILVSSLSSFVYADWTLIAQTKEGDTWEVDYEKAKIAGDIFRTWFKVTLKNPKPWQEKHISQYLHLYELDCRSERYRSLQTVHYYKDGTRKGSYRKPEWKHIIPHTALDGIKTKVCIFKDQKQGILKQAADPETVQPPEKEEE